MSPYLRRWRRLNTGLRIMMWCGLLAACGLSADEHNAIRTWLLCDECGAAERNAVTSLGNDAVPVLDSALRRALAQDREHLRRRLIENYRRLGYPPAGRDAYVARHLGDFDAQFQTQAATALRQINTSKARQALERAVDSAQVWQYRPNVIRVVHGALVQARGPSFGGLVAPVSAAFLDTITVSEGTGAAWDGDEDIVMVGAPFPNGLRVVQALDFLKFLVVGEPGPHSVMVTNIGPAQDTQVTQVNVTRIGYAPSPPFAAPNVTAAGPFPQRLFLALGTRGSDTMDYFRIEPAAALSVTARVDWRGVAPASLSWHGCTGPYGFASLPGANTVAGRVLDVAGLPVGSALVAVIGTAASAVTDGLGEFSMVGVWSPQVQLRVTRIGFSTGFFDVQPTSGRHLLTLLRPDATRGTVLNARASTVTFGVGTCRLLKVRSSRSEILRLGLTSP